jgi:DNA-binding CsgD family transcriptional regulator
VEVVMLPPPCPAEPLPRPGVRDNALLSSREQQILQCLINGLTNKGIARDLDISEATVKVHIKALLRKTRLANRTQAAIWALNNAPDGKPPPAAAAGSPKPAKPGDLGQAGRAAAGGAIDGPAAMDPMSEPLRALLGHRPAVMDA